MKQNKAFDIYQLASETEKSGNNEEAEQHQEPDRKEIFPNAKNWLRNTPYDFFILSGGIDQGSQRAIFKQISEAEGNAQSAILWLTTPGGSPDAAYMIARAFQRKYKEFIIFIDGYCKSSGSLICLGADKLIMDEVGHLGPLDIQILNREEFGERHSGLNPVTALDALGQQATDFLRRQFLDVRLGGALSTKQALEVSTNLVGQLLSPITAQLDFMKYGEFTRSMRIGIEYGQRLTQHRESSNLKKDAVFRLAMEYPSHGFAIDREEARETLFSQVEDAPLELTMLADELAPIVDKHLYGSENSPLFLDLRHALGIPLPSEQDDRVSSNPEAELLSNPDDREQYPGGVHDEQPEE